jgi:hypothetical protein
MEGQTVPTIKEWAKKYKLAVAGSFIAKDNGKFYNRAFFITPEGEEFKEQIRPILDQVYVYAEQVIGIESIELMLSELKGVYDVLENV